MSVMETPLLSFGASAAGGPLDHHGGLLPHSISAPPSDADEKEQPTPSYLSSDDSLSECDSTTTLMEGASPFSLKQINESFNTAKELHCHSVVSKLRRVSFSIAQIRHYGITIGDHPLTHLYPLTLDWCYNTVDERISIDDCERMRDDRPHRNSVPASRGIKAPRLTVNQRIERLVDVTGMSGRELFALERKRQTIAQEECYVRRNGGY